LALLMRHSVRRSCATLVSRVEPGTDGLASDKRDRSNNRRHEPRRETTCTRSSPPNSGLAADEDLASLDPRRLSLVRWLDRDMNSELRASLVDATASEDFPGALNDIVDGLDPSDTTTVPVLLRFMEEHPDLDFGTPGPLVHFVEQFYRQGYEAELLASLARSPTSHTLWMLNRIINGTAEPNERARLLEALRASADHPSANEIVRNTAHDFLRYWDE
jgi:hypothetical protein